MQQDTFSGGPSDPKIFLTMLPYILQKADLCFGLNWRLT